MYTIVIISYAGKRLKRFSSVREAAQWYEDHNLAKSWQKARWSIYKVIEGKQETYKHLWISAV